MMKQLYATLGLLLITATSWAQSGKFWADRAESVLFLENQAEANIFPEAKRVIDLDFYRLEEALRTNAPDEFSGANGYDLSLPLHDGSVAVFRMYYSPVYEAGYQELHPDIRTYKGFDVNNKDRNIRMTISPLGVKASIFTPNGEIYIDPFVHGQKQAHAVYHVKDFPGELLQEANLGCGVDDATHSLLDHFDFSNLQGGNALRGAGESTDLRTYRAAIAATGEWSLAQGGKAAAEARVIAAMDRLNLVYENEVGVRLLVIVNNDQIVFGDPQTDPYTQAEPKSGRDLIAMNTNVLDRFIGTQNYDVGHVFTRRCSDVGGVASLASVCQDPRKGSATTCWASNDLEYVVVRIFAHEMGHQFSATHTMNLCDNDNETLSTGYEPGSGSTIMSYGGLCGSNNVVSGSTAARDITYFHANSLMRMYSFSRQLNCGNTVSVNNTKPTATMDYADGFTIPVSTPFYLEGEGMDMEGDNLTYCFEQHDAASKSCQLGMPEGACPSFRSFPPNGDDYRVFPRFLTVWNNQTFSTRNEVPVDYTREYNFVMTVRDNNSEAGAWGMDTVTFFTDENAGPFSITYPNNGEEQIAGDIVEITWDVANTDVAPVNCREVDILLYNSNTWGDYTVLKSNTENDGSEWIALPEQANDNVRIMVVASENIFFDISNRDFDIVDPAGPGYAWGLSPNSARVCLPDVFTTEIFAKSISGFTGNIDLDVTGGLPAGATFNFDETSIDADGSTMLTIDLSDVEGNQMSTVEVRGISDAGDTLYRNISFEIVSNDYSEMTLTTPADGEQGLGQNPTFNWEGVVNADLYNWQLATSPAFDAGSIIQEEFNTTSTSISLNDILDKNVLYYWRVQGINVCGTGDWTIPNAFSTEAASCKEYVSQDVNVQVPNNSVSTYNLNIDVDAEINDLNVCNLNFFCNILEDATITLISPRGTRALIAEQECGNTTEYNCSFDDSGRRLSCPPNDGRSYRPAENFSIFNGERAIGRWQLEFELTRFASGAELGGWCLEVCVNQTLDAPFLINNETMLMRPNENSPIKNALLLSGDNNNSASELEYSLLSLPANGEVLRDGSPLSLGRTFTQDDINNNRIRYRHLTGQEDTDQFVFTVNDGEGGWTGSHIFNIDAKASNPSSTNDLEFRQLFTIFPNPTNGITQMVFTEELAEDVTVEIHNLQGQTIKVLDIAKGTTQVNLDFAAYQSGVYLVKTQAGKAFFVEKVTVQNN